MSDFPGAVGLVVSAGVAVAGMVVLSHSSGKKGLSGGLVAVVAATAGLTAQLGQGILFIVVPVALLAVGGWMTRLTRWGYLIVALGASLVTIPLFPQRPLFKVACVVYIMFVGWAIGDMERRKGPLVPVLLAISMLGVYFTVPEAAIALPLVGGSLAYLAFPRLGHGAAMALTGIVVWAAAVGGIARTGSIVGALACFGLLIVEPTVRRLAQEFPAFQRAYTARHLTPRFIVTVQLLVVTLVSRVAGFREKSEVALVLAGLALTLGWVLLFYDLPVRLRRRYAKPLDGPAVTEDA